MGTFSGHIVPGLAFTFLGLWHTFNTIFSYKSSITATTTTTTTATTFRSRTWYPLPVVKQLELILILSFSLLAILSDFTSFPSLHLSFKPNNSEHATMFLHLTIYSLAALAVDFHLPNPEALDPLLGVLGSTAFFQELFLLHFHSADHAGLEGHYHRLLQLIAVVSFTSTICTTASPSSFAAAVVRSASVAFQGLWFIDMGFVLWGPGVLPTGCVKATSPEHGAVVCETEAALGRGMAMANLQFSWIMAGVWVFVACLCLKSFRSTNCMEYRRIRGEEGLKQAQGGGGV